MAEFNPYAAPEAEIIQGRSAGIDEGRGVWADGKILVMAKAAHLPHRCVKCNEPATAWVTRQFMWHPIGWFLFVMLGLIPYQVVALIVRNTAKVALPLCKAHRDSRSKAFRINWLVGLGGFALCFAPAFGESLIFLFVIGIFLIFCSLIYAAAKSPIVAPKRIDRTHAWFRNVGPAFLASLPPLPEPVVAI